MLRTTLGLVALGAAIGGCGSSGGSGSTAVGSSGHHIPRPTHVYRVAMSPVAGAHASKASGVAIIALHDPSGEVCWRFAHLHGFTGARSASITAPGVVIHLSTSSKLHHQGCRHLTSAALSGIARTPGRYTVTIPTLADPRGAVSAHL